MHGIRHDALKDIIHKKEDKQNDHTCISIAQLG